MPLCDVLDCVHPYNEGLHRGLLPRRGLLVRPTLLGVSILVSLFCRLALTENHCHFHTLLPFTCADDFCVFLWHARGLQFPRFGILRTVFLLDEVSFLFLLLCTVFLLNADPSLLTWLCTSRSAGFASVWWSFPALVLSLKLVCCRVEILQHLSWRLHHCIRRPSCGLLEVGLR